MIMEETKTDGDGRLMFHPADLTPRATSGTGKRQLRSTPTTSTTTNDVITTDNVTTTTANRLLKMHERIIADVSLLQQRWIKQQSQKTITEMTKEQSTLGSRIHQNQKRELLQRLHSVRKHRMALTAKMEASKRVKSTTTTAVTTNTRSSSVLSTPITQNIHDRHDDNPSSRNDDRNNNATATQKKGLMVQQPSNNDNDISKTTLRHLLMYDSNYQRMIWNQIRSVRQQMCISAVYRLTGVSIIIPNDDDDNNNDADDDSSKQQLVIRFDIGNTNSYDCTFDLVHLVSNTNTTTTTTNVKKYSPTSADVNDDSKSTSATVGQLFLRLVHHNVPPAIPITTIFHKSMNRFRHGVIASPSTTTTMTTSLKKKQKQSCVDSIFDCDDPTMTMMIPIGPDVSSMLLVPEALPAESSTNSSLRNEQNDNCMKQLQFITQQIYHCCHAFHVRKEMYEFLQRRQQQVVNDTNTNGILDTRDLNVPYLIQQLQCTNVRHQPEVYKTLQFHILHQLSSIDHIHITLHYTTDLCRLKAHLPTSVTVKVISPISMNQYMDDDDDILYSSSKSNKQLPFISSSLLHIPEGTVSDVDEERNYDDDNGNRNHDEFIERTIRSFRTLPIQNAIRTVTDEMTEY